MTVTVNTDKGTREIDAPDCWYPSGHRKTPVTTNQYIKLVTEWDGKDLVKLFSIFTGVEYKIIADSHDYTLEEKLIYATKFVYEEEVDFKKLPVPECITIKGKEIKFNKDVGGLTIAQNIHVRTELDKIRVYESGEPVYDELIAYACALFLQPLYDESEFDFHRAMELEQEILHMPITDTYALGFFLLRPVMKSGKGFGMELTRIRILLRNIFTRSGAVRLMQ
jgi:hypothetical protein